MCKCREIDSKDVYWNPPSKFLGMSVVTHTKCGRALNLKQIRALPNLLNFW